MSRAPVSSHLNKQSTSTEASPVSNMPPSYFFQSDIRCGNGPRSVIVKPKSGELNRDNQKRSNVVAPLDTYVNEMISFEKMYGWVSMITRKTNLCQKYFVLSFENVRGLI